MKWYKPKERLPAKDETVLVRQGPSIQLAVYDEANSRFLIKTGGYYELTEPGLAWMGLAPPGYEPSGTNVGNNG